MPRILLFLSLFCGSTMPAISQTLYFPPATGSTWETTTPESLGWCLNEIDSLYQFLDEENTKAFLVLKDGKIVLEKYFDTFQQDSVWYWASAGKSLTGFLIGMAQQEGQLSIYDKTSDYLGTGWTNCLTTEEDKITVRHQLTMTTGLNDQMVDVDCTVDTCLTCLENPGDYWAYHNAPYTLLQDVFEASMGVPSNTYLFQQIRPITGMVGAYIPLGFNKVFFSTPRSFARFGLLVQNKGTWDTTPIMTDTAYFNQMINTSQSLNESYGYLWWLNGKDSHMLPRLQLRINRPLLEDAPADMIIAAGKNGQYLNIVPSQGLVVVRMGDAPGGISSLVPTVLNNDIWKHLNEIMSCTTTNTKELLQAKIEWELFPNPVRETLSFTSNVAVQTVKIFDFKGTVIKQMSVNANKVQLDVSTLQPGMYLVEVMTEAGPVMEKVVKH